MVILGRFFSIATLLEETWALSTKIYPFVNRVCQHQHPQLSLPNQVFKIALCVMASSGKSLDSIPAETNEKTADEIDRKSFLKDKHVRLLRTIVLIISFTAYVSIL